MAMEALMDFVKDKIYGLRIQSVIMITEKSVE